MSEGCHFFLIVDADKNSIHLVDFNSQSVCGQNAGMQVRRTSPKKRINHLKRLTNNDGVPRLTNGYYFHAKFSTIYRCQSL